MKMIIEASDQIWNFAELGLVEVKSARVLSEIQENYGFAVEDDVHIDREIHDPWDEGIVWPGSTDTGDVRWIAPTMEFSTATVALEAAGNDWQWTACCGHSIGHKSLIFAIKVITGAAVELVSNPDFLKKIKDEYAKKMTGKKYKCPIPVDVNPLIEIAKKASGIED